MVLNGKTPSIDIDPETYKVFVDGKHALSELYSFSTSFASAGVRLNVIDFRVAQALNQQKPLLVQRLRSCLAAQTEVIAGVSELPNGCRIGIRLLGQASSPMKRVLRLAWNEARIALLGVPAPDLRKG